MAPEVAFAEAPLAELVVARVVERGGESLEVSLGVCVEVSLGESLEVSLGVFAEVSVWGLWPETLSWHTS